MGLAETLKARVRQRRPRIVATPRQWREIKRKLFERCGGICEEVIEGVRCTREAVDAAHIIARSQGGDDMLSNLKGKCRVHHDAERGIRTFDAYTTLSEIQRRVK